jgi:hypothetical protein
MPYRHPRMPLSRERRLRTFWAASFKVENEFDLLFGSANPNPERRGCPGLWLVFAMACRSVPMDHPGHEHLAECSPCYREFRGIQQTETRAARWRFRLARSAGMMRVRLIRRWRRLTRRSHSHTA